MSTGFAPRPVTRPTEPEGPMTDRKRLVEALRALRRQGFVTRPDFLCCRSCAIDAICRHVYDQLDHDKPQPVSAIYWHGQDDELAFEGGDDLVKPLMIRHGFETDDFASDPSAPWRIVEELRAAGLDASWTGEQNRCIEIEPIAVP